MKVRENISLLGMNSFGFDVSARRLVEFASAEDLRQAFASMPSGEPWYVLGGGNNVLFIADYGGTLLHPLDRSVTLEGGDGERALVRVGAGAEWDDFVGWAVGQGLGGIENLVADTGCAGAAPVQNIALTASRRRIRSRASSAIFRTRTGLSRFRMPSAVSATATAFSSVSCALGR